MRHAFTLLALLFCACRRGLPPQAQEPQQTLEDLTLSQSTLGRPSWRLEARKAVLEENSSQAALENPRMRFYKNGKPVSTLSALSGLVRMDTQDVRLSSSVVVTSLEDGSVLKTEELRYSSRGRKFLTEHPVHLARPGGEMRGRGLEASEDLSEIRVFDQRTVIEDGSKLK